MSIFQHIKFGARILILLLIMFTLLMYYYSSGKAIKHVKNFKTNAKRLPSAKLQSPNGTAVSRITEEYTFSKDSIFRFGNDISHVKLAVVLCGERLNQTIVTLKSAAILTTVPLHFIIVADDENRNSVKDQLLSWPSSVLKDLSFEVHPIMFPNGSAGEEWRKLFKLCACQRLFLPSQLRHIDSLIYVDTDVIFMSPVENLWHYFHEMNDSQIAGLAPEHEDFATGWYNRFARHPFYEPLGVNSGVMLMNLTRMREFKWETYLQPVMKEYKLKIVWGDQDIINIIFHFHSDKLYIFTCDWNFRPDHCMYSSVCKSAEKSGVKVIHGNRGVYQNDKQPVFKAIYEAFSSYKMGTDLRYGLLDPMRKVIEGTFNTNCGKIASSLTKALEQSILSRSQKQR